MRLWIRRLIGCAVGITGIYWMLEGVGAISGSFMANNGTWALVGLVMALFGLWLVAPAKKGRPTPRAAVSTPSQTRDPHGSPDR
jgi:hypothetical protein